MIEKQPTSLTPPSASKEFITSLVDSLALRHDFSDKNTTKEVMKQWPNYADEVWRRHELEQERLDAEQVARTERLTRPLYSESLHRRVILGTTAVVLAVGGVSAWATENDRASTAYELDTGLSSKDKTSVVNEYIDPPSDTPPIYEPPRPPESEYPNQPSDTPPKYDPSPPEYGNENPSNNDGRNYGDLEPKSPGMEPVPNDGYDNPDSSW